MKTGESTVDDCYSVDGTCVTIVGPRTNAAAQYIQSFSDRIIEGFA